MADEPADEAPSRTVAPSPDAADARPGDFERYALIAALTLVVLCLLLWDRRHASGGPGTAPPPDRALRVELGGGAPPAVGTAAHTGQAGVKRASADPPAPAPPAPAPQRTYVVKDGDSLYALAKQELGSSARAKEIADLNAITDAAKIRKGQVLKLPVR